MGSGWSAHHSVGDRPLFLPQPLSLSLSLYIARALSPCLSFSPSAAPSLSLSLFLSLPPSRPLFLSLSSSLSPVGTPSRAPRCLRYQWRHTFKGQTRWMVFDALRTLSGAVVQHRNGWGRQKTSVMVRAYMPTHRTHTHTHAHMHACSRTPGFTAPNAQ